MTDKNWFEEFVRKAEAIQGGAYTVVSRCRTNNIPVLVRHNIPECGYVYTMTPAILLRDNNEKKCPKCRKKLKVSILP